MVRSLEHMDLFSIQTALSLMHTELSLRDQDISSRQLTIISRSLENQSNHSPWKARSLPRRWSSTVISVTHCHECTPSGRARRYVRSPPPENWSDPHALPRSRIGSARSVQKCALWRGGGRCAGRVEWSDVPAGSACCCCRCSRRAGPARTSATRPTLRRVALEGRRRRRGATQSDAGETEARERREPVLPQRRRRGLDLRHRRRDAHAHEGRRDRDGPLPPRMRALARRLRQPVPPS